MILIGDVKLWSVESSRTRLSVQVPQTMERRTVEACREEMAEQL